MGLWSRQTVVRTPLPRRLQQWRRKFLPVGIWLAALAAIGVLLGRHPIAEDATGVVVLREIPVSPVVDGHVARIESEAGATATAGTPVVVVSAKGGDQAVAYMPEHLAREVPVGMRVRVSSRRTPRVLAEAEVLKVSPQIESYPLQLQPSPNMMRWGAPILIGKLPEDFLPGEVIHVRFLADAPE